ncbi:5-oxoprolinase [Pseudonocardia sulfidoxydans NBRC 16205]|uniref:5-oxoprolinase n=1 Tax=Pseudonocardia sulfidoxydans NBRC 16205 TaxID=1223511 RepID=A0A511DKB4_9PSEU|nr:hydantoinase/oxoprolinase family protein [Pseudonocardia sulfidoxydans]GEL25232.1 5-oxoprolinase [Pseudonocardia sulfidoxydans NBRC 16205]
MANSDATLPWWVGVDVGGTFTDVIAMHRDTGETRDHKVLTTRGQLQDGVLAALGGLGIPLDEIAEIVHGHTSGINAVLSRQGASVALLATEGHRDLLDIGRMDREFGPHFYDPTWLRPHQERPVARRRHRFGIRERIGWDGTEVVALDKDQVRDVAARIRDAGIESVAICFLNSYLNQSHEQQAAEILRDELPGVYIQTSQIYPVTKEHERTVTVALDAYVGPIVTTYLDRLEDALSTAGFRGTLWMMTMNGGVGSVAETSKAPVFQLVSGPVGGVAGSVDLARASGDRNLLTMDMGGTSTDVAAVREAATPMTDTWAVEFGLTMTMPVVDVGSVGSGAGSIVHIDSVGTLRVGPESAGSVPGPASYGRGGERPTLTDACVVLGILQPDLFAGGALTLDIEKARAALKTVADPLGMSVDELADGAYRLACSDVAGSIRSISTYRGLDLRDFGLLAFGSAGPMIAHQVARELGVDKVVVPQAPGEFSAFGLLTSDLRVTTARSPMTVLSTGNGTDWEGMFTELEDQVASSLGTQGAAKEDIVFERAIYAMYSGQTWDNRLDIAPGEIDDVRIKQMTGMVHDFYQQRYGFSAEELPIVVTTVEVTGRAPRATLPKHVSHAGEGDPVLRRTTVRLEGVTYDSAPVYKRDLLPVGEGVSGPALIVEDYATTVVQAGSTATQDAAGILRIVTDGKDGHSA